MYKKVENIEFQLQYTLQNKCSGSEVMFFAKKTKRLNNEQQYLRILNV